MPNKASEGSSIILFIMHGSSRFLRETKKVLTRLSVNFRIKLDRKMKICSVNIHRYTFAYRPYTILIWVVQNHSTEDRFTPL